MWEKSRIGELTEQDGYDAFSLAGGNVAMDSVLAALRLGADNAYTVCRRGREELPITASGECNKVKPESSSGEVPGERFSLVEFP